MQVEVGAVVEGTVTGITKFGAFVSLPDGTSGLVHISEIANTYVNDVNEFLKLGDKVKVRVLAVTPVLPRNYRTAEYLRWYLAENAQHGLYVRSPHPISRWWSGCHY